MSYSPWRLAARILSGAHVGKWIVKEQRSVVQAVLYTVEPGQVPIDAGSGVKLGNFPYIYDVTPDH